MVFTIGHSTHPLPVFVSMLQARGVECVVDVRTVPRSAHNPQYNRETLPAALAAEGIVYEHMAGLGGLRKANAQSVNTAWRNLSFRGFADYMGTSGFDAALETLVGLSSTCVPALMCAEGLPWRCHRSLIADALTAKGIEVTHILPGGKLKPHSMTLFARIEGTKVTYPEE